MNVREATTMTATSQDAMPTDLLHRVPSLQILAGELDEFKRTGRHLHLLHAVRALDDARVELRQFVHHQMTQQLTGTAELEQQIDERQQ